MDAKWQNYQCFQTFRIGISMSSQEIKAERFREMKVKGIKEVCGNTGWERGTKKCNRREREREREQVRKPKIRNVCNKIKLLATNLTSPNNISYILKCDDLHTDAWPWNAIRGRAVLFTSCCMWPKNHILTGLWLWLHFCCSVGMNEWTQSRSYKRLGKTSPLLNH